MAVDVLTVSSKGQIVLPAPIRSALSIAAGDKLAAYASDGAILLKPLELPKESELELWLDDMKIRAKKAGLTEMDVADAIKEVRSEKHA